MDNLVLAILVPTLEERASELKKLLTILSAQIRVLGVNRQVEIFTELDNRQVSTGVKRNILVDRAVEAKAKAICFFDDDDIPSKDYLEKQFAAAISDKDCGSLWGQIYWKGKPGKPFHHSLRYKEWWEDDKYYYRCPNHLNVMKLDRVKEFRFQDKVFGEDGNWSMDINNAGALRNEYEINSIIYHYYA